MDKVNKTALFLILAFVFSYSLVGLYSLFGGSTDDQVGMIVMGVLYMFMPMLSAIIVKKFIHNEPLKLDLLISFKINKWFFVAWIITPVIGFITFGISLLFPDVSYSPEMTGMMERFEDMLSPEKMKEMKDSIETLPIHPFWLSLFQGLIAGITINAVAGFGEELGWRGFLLKAFREMTFLKASVLTGFIWGVWHAPLILIGHNYPQHPEFGVIMMIGWCILLSPLFMYITIKSRSVIAASIMHGTLNGTAGIPIMLIEGGSDLTVGITGLAGFLALIFMLIALFIFDRIVTKEKILTSFLSEHI